MRCVRPWTTSSQSSPSRAPSATCLPTSTPSVWWRSLSGESRLAGRMRMRHCNHLTRLFFTGGPPVCWGWDVGGLIL
ncbi:hypothetical protein F751_0177 [Auxenochlorella protothecoides]|uniref:Uncharacterized protein n=1 Tax=Auxenochlorella protothecoides TaxID=3075 RepID=A0A087S9Z3_AUXPR|nr:hypothetical protein F751_0177 [Auxenochlorella protothecoides]KFM22547.1 hypothetical protein F751_0177 [Auxenochlorella protothecoides]